MLSLPKPLILASQSPRRKELLNLIGLDFEVDVPTIFQEFTPTQISDPNELVIENAKGKVAEVKSRHSDSIILGVDTVVVIDGQILGKPSNEDDAEQMLNSLQGRTHEVHTGVALFDPKSQQEITFVDKTEVDFRPMTVDQIKAYVATGEPMDKAGAYAIQGKGAVFISGIRGDFFSVMGLPISPLYEFLRELVWP